jgi:hypothetical protein
MLPLDRRLLFFLNWRLSPYHKAEVRDLVERPSLTNGRLALIRVRAAEHLRMVALSTVFGL